MKFSQKLDFVYLHWRSVLWHIDLRTHSYIQCNETRFYYLVCLKYVVLVLPVILGLFFMITNRIQFSWVVFNSFCTRSHIQRARNMTKVLYWYLMNRIALMNRVVEYVSNMCPNRLLLKLVILRKPVILKCHMS